MNTEAIQGIVAQAKELCWLRGMALQDVIFLRCTWKGTGTAVGPQSKNISAGFVEGSRQNMWKLTTSDNLIYTKNLFFQASAWAQAPFAPAEMFPN